LRSGTTPKEVSQKGHSAGPGRLPGAPMTPLRALPGAPLHAAAHITGGGLLENPPRALPEQLAMALDLSEVRPAPVFAAIAAQGVERTEMLRTFNCGIGMLLVVDAARTDDVVAALRAVGEPCMRVGTVVPRRGEQVELSNVPV